MRIVVAHHNPASCERWRNALAAELPGTDVIVWSDAETREADYAIAWAAPSRTFFEAQPRLKAFFSTGAGVEKLLASSYMPADLPVIRLEDAGMGEQMATYCVGAALNWMRQRDEYAAHQLARRWQPLPREDPADWPVGIFGLGVLGQQVATAFAALGFRVNGYARSVHAIPGVRCFAESGGVGDFAAFLAATRILVILAPLTPQTRDRFGRDELAQLAPHSCVINVARGELLVEEALLALLDSGHLLGAALDVFRQEPLPPDHPFWMHPKIRITPHVSAITVIGPSARQVADKIRQLERGESVGGIVDRSRGY
ncbi:MAG TPA: glyoxylate/hydroxypyruvate reductase A [Povalibacter sp.]|uniref:2-hydroxyacid dehydrogenase n=1 Tax=Povalibacter sp. TaxID=1962978 RepID=UPI002BDFE06A|nr:glyoxylate/hydroxypyruvate reductase A [Povalibacter sp.]HMN44133.1 glyoxylate/hydroxypyruvate reductase A [Povalibacter sp.]